MTSSLSGKVLRGAAIISLFSGIGKALGFVQKQVLAHCFGTGMEADVFILAYSSVISTFFTIPQNLLAAFLPLFAERKEKAGEEEAWRFASSVGIIVVAVMAVAVVAGVVWAPSLISIVSSFDSTEAAALGIRLTRIMLPAALFMGLFYLCALILNSYKRFALPAMGDTLNKAIGIGLLVVLYRSMGIKGLAVGVVAGAMASLALQCFGLRGKLGMVRLSVDWKDPLLRKFGLLLPPILITILFAQARTILDYKFASGMGAGYTSSLNYARVLTDSLVLIVPIAFGQAIYPFFSDLAAQGDRTKLGDTLMRSVRMMAFVFIPLSVLFIALRVPIVQLAFQRGKFGMASVDLTTGPLLYYSMGLTFFAVEITLLRFYFSVKDTLTPALVGIACVFIHVGVVLTFRHLIEHQSMALAATVSKLVKVAVLLWLLRFKAFDLQARRNLAFLLKSLASAACMAGLVWLLFRGTGSLLPVPAVATHLARAIYLSLQIGVSSVGGLLVFGALALALKMEEAEAIRNLLKGNRKGAPQN